MSPWQGEHLESCSSGNLAEAGNLPRTKLIFQKHATSGRSGPICLLQVLSHLELWRLWLWRGLCWRDLKGVYGFIWLINSDKSKFEMYFTYLDYLYFPSVSLLSVCHAGFRSRTAEAPAMPGKACALQGKHCFSHYDYYDIYGSTNRRNNEESNFWPPAWNITEIIVCRQSLQQSSTIFHTCFFLHCFRFTF